VTRILRWRAEAVLNQAQWRQLCAASSQLLTAADIRKPNGQSNRSSEFTAILAGKLRKHSQDEQVRDFLRLASSPHAGSIIGR
jgi:crotonobetainyl-CoA:carnitine CoA-transferase CaiB-like acyl-CoA transferase